MNLTRFAGLDSMLYFWVSCASEIISSVLLYHLSDFSLLNYRKTFKSVRIDLNVRVLS